MSTRTQLVFAWVAAACVLVDICAFLIAGYIPPPAANLTAEQLAGFYSEHATRLRIGIVVLYLGWSGWGLLVAGIATQMRRIDHHRPALTYLQIVSGTTSWLFLLPPTSALGAAAFRPERSPEITQALHDLAWITAFMAIVPFCVQNLAIAAAVLKDRRAEPVFPRWFGYFNIWVCVLFVPAVPLICFKTGPLSYNGLFVFWVPMVVFATEMLVLAWAIRDAALRDARLNGAELEPRPEPATIG
ncbi:MAG TPA: hypothetical protein VL595_20525 [Pseudonocardia sp.]|jgi:hypothetical protein|nr:hypothetical protein [Pseudonocardia sp.]